MAIATVDGIEVDDSWIKQLFGIGLTPEETQRAQEAATAYASACAQAEAEAQQAKARLAQHQAEARANRCKKCGGTGLLPQYAHRNNGSCYRCGGTGEAI